MKKILALFTTVFLCFVFSSALAQTADYNNLPFGGGGYGTKIGKNGTETDYSVEYSQYFYAGTREDDFKECTGYAGDGDGCPNTSESVQHKYYDKMSGKCGCPSTPQYKVDGCNITISCDLEDDSAATVEVKVPCPTVAVTDPQYPLVKMLSGTLVEWKKSGVAESNLDGFLSWGAPGGTGEPDNFYGTEAKAHKERSIEIKEPLSNAENQERDRLKAEAKHEQQQA